MKHNELQQQETIDEMKRSIYHQPRLKYHTRKESNGPLHRYSEMEMLLYQINKFYAQHQEVQL